MSPDISTMAKDAVSQGGLVWTLTQIIKGGIRWRAAGDPPDFLIQSIAAMLSVLVAAASVPREGQLFDDWLLQIFLYGLVVVLPVALAGHEVAQIGKKGQSPPPPAS